MEGPGARVRLASGAMLCHSLPLLAEAGRCARAGEREGAGGAPPVGGSGLPELVGSTLAWSLLLLFVWHCHRVGRAVAGSPRPPRASPELETPSPHGRGRYARLREYARLYSWAGMGRVHRALRGGGGGGGEPPGVGGIQRPGLLHLPELPSCPVLPRDAQRHDVELLEGHYPSIAAEFERAQREVASGWGGHAGGWRTFHLYHQGAWVPAHCRACPRTYRALTALRSFINSNSLGGACFAVLQPGTTLQGQYGLTNTRLRCQLGLKTPGGCQLVVGGEPQCWSQGYCLLVDDSFLHSISHTGGPDSGPCALFVVDLWHPNLVASERQALDFIFAPG